MVFLVNSLVYMLQSASWTVFNISDNLLHNLKAERIDPLCGYSITYYQNDESATEINLVPVKKEKKKYIVLQVDNCTEWYDFLDNAAEDQTTFVKMHEKVKELVKMPVEKGVTYGMFQLEIL